MKKNDYVKAHDLRTQGLTYREIAKKLGVSSSTAHKFVQMKVVLESANREWAIGIPRRIAIPLHRAGFTSKEELVHALKHDQRRLLKCRGISHVSLEQLQRLYLNDSK